MQPRKETHQRDEIAVVAPSLPKSAFSGEAKAADENSHAGWNPCELLIGELPGQMRRIERAGHFGCGEPLTQAVKPFVNHTEESALPTERDQWENKSLAGRVLVSKKWVSG